MTLHRGKAFHISEEDQYSIDNLTRMFENMPDARRVFSIYSDGKIVELLTAKTEFHAYLLYGQRFDHSCLTNMYDIVQTAVYGNYYLNEFAKDQDKRVYVTDSTFSNYQLNPRKRKAEEHPDARGYDK